MTRKEKVQILSRYREIDVEIDRLCEEVSIWRARSEKITPTYSNMPKGGVPGNRIQDAVEKMQEIDKQINEQIDRTYDYKMKVLEAVSAVKHITYKTILNLFFIERQKPPRGWGQVASLMGYSERQCRRLYCLALDSIDLKDVRKCP